jgi:hypothetical protein
MEKEQAKKLREQKSGYGDDEEGGGGKRAGRREVWW